MRLAGAALVAIFAVACGLPDEVREQAESLEARTSRVSEEVDEKAGQLDRFIAESDNAFLRPYFEREIWPKSFEKAREELTRAGALIASDIAPLLSRDDADEEVALREQIKRVRASIDRATQLAREPAQRAAFLRDARDRAPDLVSEAKASADQATETLRSLATEVARGQNDYPEKREDLAGRLAAAEKLAREATNDHAVASGEYAKGGDADWARLADAALAVTAASAAIAASDAALRGKVGELYRSYSKTLIDMKEVSTVEIGRTSWNESVDFPRETEVRFPVEVDPETLEALEAHGDRPIATLSSFWGRTSMNLAIDRALWDGLRIDAAAGLPSRDNAAEYWVGETSSRYFHRYTVVEGEQSSDTDWVPVDEAAFEDKYDDLGMDVVAKPYGTYEDDALDEAAPPGMAYVGNPKYGQWEADEQGRRRWSWGESFLFYYLVFGGPRHHYYYNDWDRWNRGYRGRAGWYGPAGRSEYGTYGNRTRNSSRYSSSGFGRGGGFRRADRSVRGAGPRGRGGGPGGGGK